MSRRSRPFRSITS
ncbi:unnamed protein product, partial [Rotaria sp. Silwood2]